MAIGLLSNVGPTGQNMVPFFWSDFLRENLFPNMYFRSLGTKVVVPQGYGNTIKIPRWKTQVKPHATLAGYTAVSASAAVGYMTEGTLPTAVNLPPESISGFITGWSGAYGYSDRVVLVSMADYVAGAVKELGRQMAGRIDEYTRTKISANSTLVANPLGTAFKTASTGVLKGTNLCKLGPVMEARNVPTWEDNTYVAMINPLAKVDIFKDISANGYIPIHNYQNSQMIYRGEMGSMYGIRFLSSTMIPKYVGTAANTGILGMSVAITGSNIWVFAPDAFYAVEQAQGGFEVIHHPPGSAGTSDPANQIGSIGVKAYYGVVPAPTADYRLIRMPHGLSTLS